MQILYIGGGFVGACSAAISADSGHRVLVYDVDVEKMRRLSQDDRDVIQSTIHEEGLADLLIRNRSRITFTADINQLAAFINDVEAIFMCLPTPEKGNATGESDLSFYEKAVTVLGPFIAGRQDGRQERRLVIINKSTVPIKMIHYTRELFEQQGIKNFGIVSNPEFLVEGKAIENSIHPDRMVIGAESAEDFIILRRIYQRFYDASGIQYIEVNPYEAACGKLLANFLLFNKVVAAYDVVGRTCEYFPHVSYEQVRKILVSDPRIGTWGLYDSVYAGGSCFIKDAGSLAHQLEQAGTRAALVRGTLEANTFQRDHFFNRAQTEAQFNWLNTTVAVVGLAFKYGTNDMRNSGAIGIIEHLIAAGVKQIKVYDPAALEECKKYFAIEKNELYKRIVYATNETEVLDQTTACIICTDWIQFKTLADTVRSIVQPPYLIMDGRRILQSQYNSLQADGYDIIAVGSPFLKGKMKV